MFLEWENNIGTLQIISMKFQNSGKFQNNAINDVTVNDVTDFTELCDYNFELTCWNFLC